MGWDKITEQINPNSIGIDKRSTKEIIKIILSEDKKVIGAINDSIDFIDKFINIVVGSLSRGGRLFYLGSGTSGRLGILDAAECPPTFSTSVDLIQGIIAGGDNAIKSSIENAEDSFNDGKEIICKYGITKLDIVLGITASGSTPFVFGGLKKANELGAITGIISCNHIKQDAFIDYMIPLIVGPEVITGSTRMKAGTATKIVLNMISTISMIKLNKTFDNLMVDLKATNRKLWDRGTRIVAKLTNLEYDNALKILESAHGEVKVAIVMHKLSISYNKAKDRLKNNQSSLRSILDNIDIVN